MKTSELLDHLAVHVLDDRAEMLQGSADELWSDEFLIRQLNEAQRRLCREAWVLEDIANATAGTIQLLQGVKDYTLHKSVVRVLSARLSDVDSDLPNISFDLTRPPGGLIVPTDYFYPDFPMTDTPGRPLGWSTDVTPATLRVRPAPDATAAALQVILRVSRMPIAELAINLPDAEPEVPYEFHMDLIDYAGGKALTVAAADATMRSLGNDMLAQFNDRLKAARRERQRKEMAPVRWQFGAGARQR